MMKLRDNRGETLIEVLASILIAAMSVTLLLGSVTAASKMDANVRDMDEAYYDVLSEAEAQVTPVPPEGGPEPASKTGTITITGNKGTAYPSIVIYGDADGGVCSYKENK